MTEEERVSAVIELVCMVFHSVAWSVRVTTTYLNQTLSNWNWCTTKIRREGSDEREPIVPVGSRRVFLAPVS